MPNLENNLQPIRNKFEQKRDPIFSEREVTIFQKATLEYLKDLFGKEYAFLNSPKITSEIIQFGEEEFNKLESALVDMGWSDKKITPNDTIKLTQLAALLLQENQKKMESVSDEKKHEYVKEVTDIVSEQYGVDMSNILKDPSITTEAKSPVLHESNKTGTNEKLPDHLLPIASKKFLVDLYIHGKSLNDLGGFYAYFQEKGYAHNAAHRALASALHLVNAKTAMQIAEQGLLPRLDEIIESNKGATPQLGRMEIDIDDNAATIRAEGMTPSELAHEEIKGLLEYISLDTALPAQGEISDEDAYRLKVFLEKSSFEIIGGVYGPVLSRRIDAMISDALESKDEHVQQQIASIINLSPRELKSKIAFLRLYKVFTMLDGESIGDFYTNALAELPLSVHHISFLKKAEENYHTNL